MDFARRQLLGMLAKHDHAVSTVSSDFSDLGKWLAGTDLLLTYVAGPYPDDAQCAELNEWLRNGGRWLGLHGTSGGRAVKVEGSQRRKMVKLTHHDSLGCFFLNHPPIRRFEVKVVDSSHALTQGLPSSFEVSDELYLVEVTGECTVLLTTELEKDPSPDGFGFVYDEDSSLLADGNTRILEYTRPVDKGEVAYIALGHCHSPASNVQPFIDESVARGGVTPKVFRGVWEEPAFGKLIDNALRWGLAEAP